MSSGWDYEAFREYVIGHARNAGVASDQTSLAKLTGIDSSQLGRYFRGETQPGPKNLHRLADSIPGTTLTDLMVLAGRASADAFGTDGTPVAPRELEPRAEEINQLLGDQSPLPDDERNLLATLLDRVLQPYRTGLRRKTG